MTTERASKESSSQKTEKPKQAFSAEAGQELEAPLTTLDLTPQNILYLQRTIGNKAVQRMLTRSPASRSILQRDPKPLKLRTALDSMVTVTKDESNGYEVYLSLDKAGGNVLIARYQILTSSARLEELPIYIEDVVTDKLALVRVQFDPKLVKVQVLAADTVHDKQRVRVQAIETSTEQLQVTSAPKAKNVGPGYVIEGKEKTTMHSSGSEADLVMSGIASAEGGFASTEGSDKGIFTWGQGQWPVGANKLQPVMQFIKNKRPDLYDRYWGGVGLDVKESILYYEDQPYVGKAKLRKLFRDSKKENLRWVNLFAQAGEDPQIQRLQREYLRIEVPKQLNENVGDKSPSVWLNIRGKAFYYSMWKNAPAIAQKWFEDACKKADGATEPTDVIKDAISAELESGFKNSTVYARSGDNHHYMAFWAEPGRMKAVAEADKHIADPSLDTKWTTEQWKKHKARMEKRESRYQKTAQDISKALAGENLEPDVPKDLKVEFE